jgi:hypothetical protein
MIRRSFLKTFAGAVLIPRRGKKMPFGNAVGEGFVNSGIVIARKVIIEGANGGMFVYSSAPPALGNLIETTGIAAGGTDGPGNEYLTGFTTYYNITGTLWIATNILVNGITWYLSSTGPGGPYSSIAQIVCQTTGSISVTFGSTTGTWPQSGGSGITTVAQVVAALEAMGLLTA